MIDRCGLAPMNGLGNQQQIADELMPWHYFSKLSDIDCAHPLRRVTLHSDTCHQWATERGSQEVFA